MLIVYQYIPCHTLNTICKPVTAVTIPPRRYRCLLRWSQCCPMAGLSRRVADEPQPLLLVLKVASPALMVITPTAS